MVQEARTEQIAPSGIENHAVAGLRADVNMRVDEARNDQVATRVDYRVGGTVIVVPHVTDGVAVKSDLPVPQNTMLAGLVGDDPSALDQRAAGKGRRLFHAADLSKQAVGKPVAGFRSA